MCKKLFKLCSRMNFMCEFCFILFLFGYYLEYGYLNGGYFVLIIERLNIIYLIIL